jgi:hypothetical protein
MPPREKKSEVPTEIDVSHVTDRLIFFPPDTEIATEMVDYNKFKKKHKSGASSSSSSFGGSPSKSPAYVSRPVETLNLCGVKYRGEGQKIVVYYPLAAPGGCRCPHESI